MLCVGHQIGIGGDRFLAQLLPDEATDLTVAQGGTGAKQLTVTGPSHRAPAKTAHPIRLIFIARLIDT
jgi:hypothetical protein